MLLIILVSSDPVAVILLFSIVIIHSYLSHVTVLKHQDGIPIHDCWFYSCRHWLFCIVLLPIVFRLDIINGFLSLSLLIFIHMHILVILGSVSIVFVAILTHGGFLK